MKKLYVVLLLLLFVCLSGPLCAQTVTIYRGGVITSPSYGTLRAAVDSAIKGDSLVLSPDVFEEYSIPINKGLIIKGTISGTDSSILESAFFNHYPILVLNYDTLARADTVKIIDLTIRNGYVMTYFTYYAGAAIFANRGTLIIDGYSALYNNKSRDIMSTVFPSLLGSAIYSRGTVILKGHTNVHDNDPDWGKGAIYCAGPLYIQDSVIIRGNGGGGINSRDSCWIQDDVLIADHIRGPGIVSIGFLLLKDRVRVQHNIDTFLGGGIINLGFLSIEGHVMIKNNTGYEGGGIYSSGIAHISDSVCIDSNQAFTRGGGISSYDDSLVLSDSVMVIHNTADYGAGVCAYGNVRMSGLSTIAVNHSRRPGAGIYMIRASLSVTDSASILGNITDTTIAAGIYGIYSAIQMNGGQIIGNHSATDSVSGMGMAIYTDSSEAWFVPGYSHSRIDIKNARIFNPNGDTAQQNEICNLSPELLFSSDSSWWGDSDTAGVFCGIPADSFNLNTWVVADWSVNGGAAIGTASSFPVSAYFRLNTGPALPPGMFWMLPARFTCSDGSFSPGWSFMTPANTITSIYTVPLSSMTVSLLGIADADSFRNVPDVIGLGIADKSVAAGVYVYPNPSEGHFIVRSDNNGAVAIKIYDLSGRLIKEQAAHIGTHEVQLSAAPGTYILELRDEAGNIQRERIVIR